MEVAPQEPPGLMEHGTHVLWMNEQRDTRTEYERYLIAPPCCPKEEPGDWFKSHGFDFFCCFRQSVSHFSFQDSKRSSLFFESFVVPLVRQQRLNLCGVNQDI